MKKAELYSLNYRELSEIARDMRIEISEDYDENEVSSLICEKISEDPVAWKLLDQWL